MSLAAGFPLGLAGLAITVLVWGFLEGFFGVYFARKINLALGNNGCGWLTPGAGAFALFNGGVHLIVGQGFQGFVTSFGSGCANREMVERWVASAWLLKEKNFRKIDGHRDLWALATILGLNL